MESGHPAPVVTSAGALIEGLKALGSRRTAIITPCMQPLTNRVVSHIENEGIAVQDSIAFAIPDNLDVAAQDPKNLLEHVRLLDLSGVDTIKLSGCVQMPSLTSIPSVEDPTGLPVMSAAICTTYCMLKALGLNPEIPGAGALIAARTQI